MQRVMRMFTNFSYYSLDKSAQPTADMRMDTTRLSPKCASSLSTVGWTGCQRLLWQMHWQPNSASRFASVPLFYWSLPFAESSNSERPSTDEAISEWPCVPTGEQLVDHSKSVARAMLPAGSIAVYSLGVTSSASKITQFAD